MPRKKAFYCSIHGGPIFGRGWGGHKSHSTCDGRRMTKAEYLEEKGELPEAAVAPRKAVKAARDGSEDELVFVVESKLDAIKQKIHELRIEEERYSRVLKTLKEK